VRESTLPAAAIAFGRAAVGAGALGLWGVLPSAGVNHEKIRSYGRSAIVSLVWSGVLLAVHWLTFVMALQRVPIGTVLLGIYLAPLVVAAFASQALQEQVTRRQVAALVLSIGGSVFILQPGQTGGWDGLAIIAVSAVAYAGSILTSKKALRTIPVVRVTTGQLTIVAVLLSPLLLVHPVVPATRDYLLITALGVVYSALALLAYLSFLRHLPATTSGILLYLEPVSALVTGWIFLSEQPTSVTLVGAVLVLAAGVLATTGDDAKGTQTQSS
jgi:RarD protein